MLNRRGVIGAGAVLGLGGVSAHASSEDRKRDGEKRTYVLVHGAWHGGWCWRDVAAPLRAGGHRVFTPTMTGLGERAHLLNREIDLSTHATDIINVIQYEELERIILVGHSYAGYIVTMVADALKERISHIVYLDAALPTHGKAFFAEDAQDSLRKKYEPDFVLQPGSLEFLGIPEGHEKADWVLRRLTPHPIGAFFEPVDFKNGGADGVPKTFIRCTGNPRHSAGDPVKAMAADNDEWRYALIDTGHDAMVTAPETLARMLNDILVRD